MAMLLTPMDLRKQVRLCESLIKALLIGAGAKEARLTFDLLHDCRAVPLRITLKDASVLLQLGTVEPPPETPEPTNGGNPNDK